VDSFHASNRPPYIGGDGRVGGLMALRRLRAWHPGELERACRESHFYLVGFSPRLWDEFVL